MEKPNKKQIYSLVSLVLSVAIFALALYVFISSISARSRNGQAEIFGYSFAIVVTNSMSPEIKVGDLIIVKTCDITDIKEGDNAVFLGLSGTFKDKRVVHRVVGVYDTVDDYGVKSIYLETWGINNAKYDDDYVYSTNFIGKEIFHSTFLGAIMSFLKSPANWLYLVIIFGVIYFAVIQTKRIIKLVKAKGQEEATAGQAATIQGQEGEGQEVAEGLSEGEINVNSEEGAKSDEVAEKQTDECQEEVAQVETVTDNQADPNDIDDKEEAVTECQEEATERQEDIVTDNKDDITNNKDIE